MKACDDCCKPLVHPIPFCTLPYLPCQIMSNPLWHEPVAEGVDESIFFSVAAWLKDPQNRILTIADAEYPQLLLNTVDPPLILYVKGRLDLLNTRSLAIVGSRNASAQGLRNAEAFAKSISDAGLCIVSGMAHGIDAAAHLGGLQGSGSSIAVVGTGLDKIYPAANRELAHRLAQEGTIISEFPLGTPPLPANFPRRNRIISGLSQGCLVVEASVQSGSLITARMALEQGREVFAIPGSIHSPQSRGCHALIKQGRETGRNCARHTGRAWLSKYSQPGGYCSGTPAVHAFGLRSA